MTDTHELPLADTRDMVQLHQVFRDALTAAPTLIGSVAPGDRARAGFVANHYLNVLSLLHAHHEGEDELLTPRLLERRPEQAEVISRIGNQHEAVIGAISDAEVSLAAWESEATGPNRDAAVATLASLESSLTPHLDQEEIEILPIASECINIAEWGELPQHGMQHFAGDKPWLIMVLVQDHMSPEQVAAMQAHLPPEISQFWTKVGQHLYREHQSELNG